MSTSNTSKQSPLATSRRGFLKSSAALSAAALGPWVISRNALASSGELNILMWSDYLPPSFLEAFTAKTGITVNYTGIGSNEEIINKMKATKGRGVDICSPTNMRSPQWIDLGLLQAFDMSRISTIGNVNPAMLRVGEEEWNFGGKGSHWLPHIWGTEAVAWRTDMYAPPDGMPSYGNIWSADVKGKTMIRPHSGMLGAGLFLETTGQLEPGAMRKAYDDEETMRKTWETVTEFCIANKDQIKLFWNDADSQKNGFLNDGVVVGQTWDGPPLAMKTAGEPVTYQAPKEGALAWVDGMSLSAAAENIEQVYAFLSFCFEPEPAGKAIDKHGYNSAVLGADQFAGDQYKKNFAEAYPGDALSNLWPWPKEPQWYADVRTEYRNKFVNA
ncbi:MAG: extracellular solute-binding protein [Candidatus Competibacteraceae bacterium]|nr:extracellular solute-binding protein [Candidatus Competibacteraceae bacterium]MCB1815249.1 extracellular solute-binding protein [Candidatus Competibacteraceae bacterium]